MRRSLLSNLPNTSHWRSLKSSALKTLEELQNEMQLYFDERSEKWQESENGFDFENILDDLNSVISELEGIDI